MIVFTLIQTNLHKQLLCINLDKDKNYEYASVSYIFCCVYQSLHARLNYNHICVAIKLPSFHL